MSTTASASTYDLNVFPSIISSCPCSPVTPQQVQVSIENFYQYPDTFSFTIDGPAGFTTQIQQGLIVSPGQTKNLDLFLINVATGTAPGTYHFSIKSKSGTTGETQTKSLDVEVLNCYNAQLVAESTYKDVCIEENNSAVYYMTVQNNGKYQDTYDLSASTSWVTFSDKSLTIDAGKSQTIAVALFPPQGSLGLQTVSIQMKSQKYAVQDSKTLQLNLQDCFQMSADLQPGEVGICLGETITQKLLISNMGVKSDTYSVFMPNWVTADKSVVTLEPKKSAEIALSLKPTQKGKTYFNVTVVAAGGGSKTLPALIITDECRGVAVIMSPSQANVCQSVPAQFLISVKNLGTIQDTFNITASQGTLDSNKLVINPGETREIKLTIQNVTQTGTHKVTVTAASGQISDESSTDLVVENCYGVTMDLSPQEHSACFSTPVNYTASLKNTGKLADTYTLKMESELLNSSRQVQLGPGESRMEYFTIAIPSQPAAKDYPVKVTIASSHSSAEASASLEVKSMVACYSVQLTTKDDEKAVALCAASTMPVTIKNTGEKRENFTVSVKGPDWVYLSPDAVELSPGEQQDVYLYFSPCINTAQKGTYPVEVTVSSPIVEASKEIVIGVVDNVTTGSGGTGIQIPGINGTPSGNISGGNVTGLIIGDANTWKVIAIVLITAVIIIILAIRFILLAKK